MGYSRSAFLRASSSATPTNSWSFFPNRVSGESPYGSDALESNVILSGNETISLKTLLSLKKVPYDKLDTSTGEVCPQNPRRTLTENFKTGCFLIIRKPNCSRVLDLLEVPGCSGEVACSKLESRMRD